MNSIVITPKDPNELKFLRDLLEKLGVDLKILSEEDMEDLGMTMLMKDADRADRVSESEIMGKLKNES